MGPGGVPLRGPDFGSRCTRMPNTRYSSVTFFATIMGKNPVPLFFFSPYCALTVCKHSKSTTQKYQKPNPVTNEILYFHDVIIRPVALTLTSLVVCTIVAIFCFLYKKILKESSRLTFLFFRPWRILLLIIEKCV